MKVCSKCKVEKFESEFSTHRTGRDGLRSSCRSCVSIAKKRYSRTTTAPLDILHKYCLTKIEYELLFEKQNGLCAICQQPSVKRLGVDHCHKTHRVRGLLCNSCNLGIGCFKDDPSLLARAIKYLTGEL